MSIYQRSMEPWPGLDRYGRRVDLPKNGMALYLYDTGPAAKPPLLLVHGLADEADTWRHLIDPLAACFRVVAPDLPGFGRSDRPELAYTLPFFAGVLLELLDELEVERAVLVGHSLGGAIVQSMALARPECAERLVLIGGSLVARKQRLDLGTLLFLVPGLGEWLYNRLRNDPEAAFRSLAPYYSDLDKLPEADRDFLYQRVNERVWSDGQRRAFFSTLRELARSIRGQQRELLARLAELTAPTVVLWGELDRMNSVDNGRALVEMQPGARLVVLPGVGHNVQQEEPDAVLETLACNPAQA